MIDIFNNYDFDVAYDSAKEFLTEQAIENGESPDDVTDSDVWDEVNETEQIAWDEDVQNGLIDFLSDKTVIFQGTIGRWNGNFPGGEIGDFDTLLYEFIKDCDYIHIYDDKGHLYISATHHDGTNSVEVKILTEKGVELYDEWENDEGVFSNLSEMEIHTKIMNDNKFSEIPNFVERVWQNGTM
nr:MAG TPA: hypothetical protein [Caudoviricetes sp.]